MSSRFPQTGIAMRAAYTRTGKCTQHTHRLRASIALGRFRAPLAILAGVVIAAPSPGQPPPGTRLDFEPAQGYATGDCCPWGLAAADIDNDGDIDLVVANEIGEGCVNFVDPGCPSGAGSLTVLLNTGNWSTPGSGFAALVPINIEDANMCTAGPGPGAPREVALACIGGDILPEMVVTTATGHVVVYNNIGAGGFVCDAAYQLVCSSCSPQVLGLNGIVVADLDADGFNDLGVASRNGHPAPGVVWRMFNDQLGGFPAANIRTTRLDLQFPSILGPPFDIDAGRFENVIDQGWDLVTVNRDDARVTMIQSRPLRDSFIQSFDPPPGMSYTGYGIVRKRLDSGTTPDVGITSGDPNSEIGFSLVGDGAGGLLFRDQITPAAGLVWGVASARLDGNTSRELVYTLPGADQIAIVKGAGDGTFPGLPQFESIVPTNGINAVNPRQVVIADFNGDGFRDIAVTAFDPSDSNQGRVSILLHTPPFGGG